MSAENTLLTADVVQDIIKKTHLDDVIGIETVQGLWSGFGQIERVQIDSASSHLATAIAPQAVRFGAPHTKNSNTTQSSNTAQSAIVKLIRLPDKAAHPRGWDSPESNARKIKSYSIEANWYRHYAAECKASCRVPQYLADGVLDESLRWILIEDLDNQFPLRRSQLSLDEASICIQWLASFHRQFLDVKANDLWPVGTYWHLATRQKEFEAMQASKLKSVAAELDARLNLAEHQTLVHGDAKVANFCFSEEMKAVAAVDFQYVGRGVGVKDLAYFLGSCLNEQDILINEAMLLDQYFRALDAGPAVEAEWRELYVIAWTDFYRFLDGWMPAHQKINAYTRSVAERAYRQL